MTEEDLEASSSNILLYGVYLAASIVIFGGIFYLYEFGHTSPDFDVFTGVPEGLNSFQAILQGASRFDSASIIQLGLLILILVPVARVFFAIFAFAKRGDRMYVFISIAVFLILAYTLISCSQCL